jgi:hypothetical protein
MTNKQKFLSALVKFEYYVELGNRLLKDEYNISVSPILKRTRGEVVDIIPQAGAINYGNKIMAFRFHGAGCCFEFGEIVVEFDYGYSDINFEYKGFEPFFFRSFLQSIPEYMVLSEDRIFNESIHELVIDGLIEEKCAGLYTNYVVSRKGRDAADSLT